MSMILVIADDVSMRKVLERFLTHLGHPVVVVSGGAMGLSTAKGIKFDLVISDLAMPGMDGLETFKEIQAIDPNLKAIFISGLEERNPNRELNKLRERGLAAFVPKPFGLKEIKELVEQMLPKEPVQAQQGKVTKRPEE